LVHSRRAVFFLGGDFVSLHVSQAVKSAVEAESSITSINLCPEWPDFGPARVTRHAPLDADLVPRLNEKSMRAR